MASPICLSVPSRSPAGREDISCHFWPWLRSRASAWARSLAAAGDSLGPASASTCLSPALSSSALPVIRDLARSAALRVTSP